MCVYCFLFVFVFFVGMVKHKFMKLSFLLRYLFYDQLFCFFVGVGVEGRGHKIMLITNDSVHYSR